MKLTKIAIALAAVLAMSALVASAASAAEFKSSKSPVMLNGVQKEQHVFAVDGQKVTCNTAEFNKASQATPTKNITGVEAKYANCTAFGFAGATVNMGNCTYTFTEPNTTDGGANVHLWTSKVDIGCSGGTPITINSSVFGSECSVSVAANANPTEHIIWEVDTTNGDIFGKITVGGIGATKNKDNGLCPLSGTGTTNNATYNGTATVVGTEGTTLSIS